MRTQCVRRTLLRREKGAGKVDLLRRLVQQEKEWKRVVRVVVGRGLEREHSQRVIITQDILIMCKETPTATMIGTDSAEIAGIPIRAPAKVAINPVIGMRVKALIGVR